MKILISSIKELSAGALVESYFCVVKKTAPRSYSNGCKFMFSLTLCDKSGDIDLKYWGGTDQTLVNSIYNIIQENIIVFITGTLSEYQGRKEISVNVGTGTVRAASETEYDLADFIVSTNQSIDDMWNEIIEIKENLANDDLKRLLDAFLGDADFVSRFKRAPGAKRMHHACCGGLLEHTWEVLRYCKAVTEVHESLDKPLLFTGAILHDIGKIKVYEISKNITISKQCFLTDHIVVAVEMIKDKILNLDGSFPDDIKEKLVHLILSHHGEKRHGALVKPMLPEAAALYCADLMGSKVTQFIRAKKDAPPSDEYRVWCDQLNSYIFVK